MSKFGWVVAMTLAGCAAGPEVGDPSARPAPEAGRSQLAAAHDFTCALDGTGALSCWGSNYDGGLGTGAPLTSRAATPQAVRPSETWTMVSASARHACAIRADKTLWCWGANDAGQVGDGTYATRAAPVQIGLQHWTAVATGDDHTCAVRADGTLWCWGFTYFMQSNESVLPSPTQVGTAAWSSIALGSTHQCGIKPDASLWCWGYNSSGQVGDGSVNQRYAPVRIAAARTWWAVAAGNDHTCALATDGTLWCWGSNGLDALGDPSSPYMTESPIRVGGERYAALAVTGMNACAIRVDGTLWCWGDDQYGQLGDGARHVAEGLVQIGTADDWTAIGAGSVSTLARRADGSLYSWGANHEGQLGIGAFDSKDAPHRIDGANWASVSAGRLSTCATRRDGTLACWGANYSTPLGTPPAADGELPADVPVDVVAPAAPGTGWAQVSDPGDHTCATRTDGTLWCWGSNVQWQIGDGTNVASATPQRIGNEEVWTRVSTSTSKSCALAGDASLWCWGLFDVPADAHVPTLADSSAWRSVAASGCAVRGDGTLWCWDNTGTLTQLGTDATWRSIVGGYGLHCGTHANGDLDCWGDNIGGEVGDGTTQPRTSPVHVLDRVRSVAVSAEGERSCAIRTDKTLWCWGAVNGAHVPTQIGTEQSWAQIAVGGSSQAALRNDDTLWTWGADARGQIGNMLGQLGDGDSWRASPELVHLP